CSGTKSCGFSSPRERGPGPATASIRRRGRRRGRSPTWHRRIRIRPSLPSQPSDQVCEQVTAATISLELDDIQSGVLHERPSPYVGTYLLLRIDDRGAGRELVRRLHPVVDCGRPSSDPAHDAWITVLFTYQGLRALGGPQSSLDSFAPDFRQGMAAAQG